MFLHKTGNVIVDRMRIKYEEYAEIREKLSTIKPFSSNKKFVPTPFSIYSETHNRMIIPRQYGLKFLDAHGYKLEKNVLSDGSPMAKTYEPVSTLYDYQADCVDAFVRDREAGGYGGLMVLSTGAGKTITAIETARRLGKKVLIVTKTYAMSNQWIDEIRKILPGSDPRMKITDDNPSDFNIVIRNSIDNGKFRNFYDIGTVIVDEVHSYLSKNMISLFYYISRRYVIGVTATPKVRSGLEYLLDMFIGPTIFSLHKSYSGELPIVYNHRYVPTTDEIRAKYCKDIISKANNNMDYTTTHMNTTVNNDERVRFAVSIVKRCIDNPDINRILVVCRYVKLISKIFECLRDVADCGVFHSVTNRIDELRQEETLREKKVIIGVSALSKDSLNIVDCNCLILVTPDTMSKDQNGIYNTQVLDQITGRCLRRKWEKSPEIHIVSDTFSVFLAQMKKRKIYYESIREYTYVEVLPQEEQQS